MKNPFIIFFLLFAFQLIGQSFSTLPAMPEPVSNNAVTSAIVDGVPHVYSFSGIDATKIYSGIHQKAFRYNTQTQIWDEIAPLPSGNGRIAARASTVKNKIYIIGGYEVFANEEEISVDKTHIYNPETNSYEPDGALIPVPIDDHVQAVWRDSLIFVVTGWSNTKNVPNVQIYSPSDNSWSAGTNVPSTITYQAFGASGTIIGDTIFYLSGAKFGFNFPISNVLRKGVIDPNDPTKLTWSTVENAFGKSYRSAAVPLSDEEILWIGGAETTYNFDGIAYNGTGGVSPKTTWYRYFNNNLRLKMPDPVNTLPEVMDLQGIALLDDRQAIIAGGMLANQTVSGKVFLINFSEVVSSKNLSNKAFKIIPNPAIDFFTIEKEGQFKVSIFDVSGRLVFDETKNELEQINISNLHSGIYFVKVYEYGEWVGMEKLVVH